MAQMVRAAGSEQASSTSTLMAAVLADQAAWAAADAAAAATAATTYVPKVDAATAEGTRRQVFKITPFTNGKAPFSTALSSIAFAGIYDPLFAVGYNVDAYIPGGGGGVSGEPGLQMFFEADYNAVNWGGSGQDERTMEWYVQYVSPDHSSVTNHRPFAFTVGRNNNTDRWASVSVDIGTDASTFRSQFNIEGSVRLARFTNTAINFYKPISGGVTFSPGYDVTVGDGSAAGDSLVNLKGTSGFQMVLKFSDAATAKWQLYKIYGDAKLYTRDLVNNRMHITLTQGVTPDVAMSSFNSRIEALGEVFSGDGTTAGNAALNLKSASTYETAIRWHDTSTEKWKLYKIFGTADLLLKDSANARSQVTFTPGATSITAVSTFASKIQASSEITSGDGATADAAINLKATSGFQALTRWYDNATLAWQLYKIYGDGNLYLRDAVNSRTHVTFAPGADWTSAIATFNSKLEAVGEVGVGDGSSAGDGAVNLRAKTGFSTALKFLDNTTAKWWLYKNHGTGDLFLRDVTNSRQLATFQQGVDSKSSKTTFDSPIVCGNSTTANRPTASTCARGMWYDNTLGKPVWSDGTNWRDAAGTIV